MLKVLSTVEMSSLILNDAKYFSTNTCQSALMRVKKAQSDSRVLWRTIHTGGNVYVYNLDSRKWEQKMQCFQWEIYTKNHETGEGGWDIKIRNVVAPNKKAALDILKRSALFDCVILFNHVTNTDWQSVTVFDGQRKPSAPFIRFA